MVTPWRRLKIVIGTSAALVAHLMRTLLFSFIARAVIVFPINVAEFTPVDDKVVNTAPPVTHTNPMLFPSTTIKGRYPYPLTASGSTKLIAVCELSAVYVYLRR